MQKTLIASLAVAAGLFFGGSAAHAQNINVVVDGQPVAFNGTPPQEMNGSVLVPLRGVFEHLGADVEYDSRTRTIFATKGQTNVSLSLGSATAYVNRQPEQLAQAPIVTLGTTLVPLRFVAEALGAYVEWQPQTSTVQIQSASAGDDQNFHPHHDRDADHVASVRMITGRIVNLDNSGGPTVVTVATDSGTVQINISDRTKVSVYEPGQQPIPSNQTVLHIGQRVRADLAPDGDARAIVVQHDHHDDDHPQQ